MVRKGSRVQVSKAAPDTIKVIITPTLCGGFLVPIGAIYQQVDNSIGTVTNYGSPVKSFNNLI